MEQTKNSECTSCRKKGETKMKWLQIIGFEVVIVSIYGHYKLINLLIDYLSSVF